MPKILLSLLIAFVCHAALAANDAEKQAEDFTNLYNNTCIQYLADLDKLREKLKDLPTLPAEKAALFLAKEKGTAWIVPHQPEPFIIVLMDNRDYCAAFAHRADAAQVEKRYLDVVNHAPKEFTVVKNKDEVETVDGSESHTLSYQWQLPNNPRKPTFMLTTSNDSEAGLQAYIIIAVVTDK